VIMMAVRCGPWHDLEHAKSIVRGMGYEPFKVVDVLDSDAAGNLRIVGYKILFPVMNDEDKLAAILKFPPDCLEEFK